MEELIAVNEIVNRIVWGAPALVLLMGIGLWLTIRTGGMQFRHFPHAMKHTLGKVFHRPDRVEARPGEMTPFQAMTTALAGTVGTGSVAGVTSAICLGGPGALFWLWGAALVGMITKYGEVLLAVKYRERNAEGEWAGGPMYYIKYGLGPKWRWLAVFFCLSAALAAFGTGNTVQVGNITASVTMVIRAFEPSFTAFGRANLVIGLVTAALTSVVLFGGIQRLGAVTEKLVPAMALTYMLACLTVVVVNGNNILPAFQAIFRGAFDPAGITGGAVGSMTLALSWGIKRGVFSNEAGLGTAPMAHANTSETDPVKQGFYGIFEVFVASIVICTLTGLSLLCSGIPINYGLLSTTALNVQALGTVFGLRGGAVVIAVGISLFAFSTILSWALYGSRCCAFLLGNRAVRPYQVIYVLAVVLGAVMELDLAWSLADTLNGLMILPNLVAIFALSGVIIQETRVYFTKADE
ncbi:MAG: sodium:alanine symporter family protein [Ruminiclostridium sp.]|nr:sodium:alanine symporter family protein [Ruminiclostridium sp.]